MSPVTVELVERDGELEALAGVLEDARGGHGAAVLLEGEAGIGKSALLEAAARSAAAAGMRVLSARGAPLEVAVAYGVARQLLLPAVLEPGGRDRLLSGAAALAEPALLGSADAAPAGGEAAFATRHGLTWLVAALADEGRPLALLIDDVHWADAPSVRFLAALAVRVADAPVALVAAARPPRAWPDPALAGELGQAFRALHPARLSRAGVGACLAGSLGVEPDQAFTAAAHTETAGTPYLVTALGRALRDACIEPNADGVAAMRTLDATEVTRDVAARLTGLPAAARDLAGALAVVGNDRAAADATRLAGLDPPAAARAADALEGAGLIRGWPEPAFDHPLVAAALLDDLGAARRGEMHAAAADLAMASGDLERAAAHLAEAPGAGDPARVAMLQGVAARAMKSGAIDVAAGHLRRALAEPPTDEAVAGVLMELGLAELSFGAPEAAARLNAAARASNDPELALRARMIAGHALTFAGRWDEAFAQMRTAIAAAEGAGREPVWIARLELAAAMLTLVPTGREAGASLDGLDREMPLRTPLRPLLDGVLALRDVVEGRPRPETVALLDRSRDAVPPPVAGAMLHGARLIAIILADLFHEADPAMDATIATGRGQGDVTTVRMVSAWLAMSRARQGRLADAEEAAVGVDDGEGPPPPLAVLVRAVVGVRLALERGDLAQAAELADRRFDLDPGLAGVTTCDDFLVARGRTRMAQGDARAAAELFARAGANQNRLGAASPPTTQWRLYAAQAAYALGEHGSARDLAEEEVSAAELFAAPRPLSMALRTSAAVAATTAEAERFLRAALDRLDGEPLDLERAHVSLDLGSLLLREGKPDEAREHLRVALDLGWAAGGDAVAERARSALVAAGARPRSPRITGVRALTAAEARTARAATQMTNREIAETLFVTEKTVESQLTSVYRKLGIGGRAQLEAALDDPG